MTTVREPWAKSIEELGLYKIENISDYSEEDFILNKDKNIFPYLKKEIEEIVDPFKPCTFLPILQELNMPFYEGQWIHKIRETKNINKVIFRYIGWCKLFDVKEQGFEHSSRIFEDIWAYNNCEYIVHGSGYTIVGL